MLHGDITALVIGGFYQVYNTLGYGFLESVYEKALKIELERQGVEIKRQWKLDVYYSNHLVGEFYADLVADRRVIIELKAAENLHPQHEAQLLNYLKASDIEVGLLLNFGRRPQFVRKLFTNDLKKHSLPGRNA